MTNSVPWATTSQWVVDCAMQEVQLDEKGVGETSFTVTNFGSTQARVMFDIVPGEGASEEWFVALEPQRLVSAGGSVIYQVKVRVPPNTAAGSYDFSGRAYAADGPPEENSTTSNRVKLQVKPAAKPKRKLNPLVLIAVGVVLLLILAVAGFFLFRGGGDDTGGEVVLANQSLVVPANSSADLDTATIVRGVGGSMQFRAVGADQFIQPLGGAKIASLGVVANADFQDCAGAPVLDVLIPARGLAPGSVLCVETAQQRMAVITVSQPPGRQLNIQYDLFRHKSAG